MPIIIEGTQTTQNTSLAAPNPSSSAVNTSLTPSDICGIGTSSGAGWTGGSELGDFSYVKPGGRTFNESLLVGKNGHPEVMQHAKKFTGIKYVWGGKNPKGFDCSGLCYYSYKLLGINIPVSSRTQYGWKLGIFIAPNRLDLLVEGDMVFFGTNGNPDKVHHVGLFAGGTQYFHAPKTGDVVKFSDLTPRITGKNPDYVGAIRVP